MRNIFFLILLLILGNSLFAQSWNPIGGKNRFTDSLAFIKPKNNVTEDSVLTLTYSTGVLKMKKVTNSVIIPVGVDSITLYFNQLCYWIAGIPTCFFLQPSTFGANDSLHLNFDSTWILHYSNGTLLSDSIFLIHTVLYVDEAHLSLEPYLAPYTQFLRPTRLVDSVYASPFGTSFNYITYANGHIDSLAAGGGIVPEITVRWSVLDSLSTPPVSPSTGDIYEVGTAPTGAWAAEATHIATWDGATWTFEVPTAGDLLFRVSNDLVSKYTTVWVRVGKIPIVQGGQSIGSQMIIGTTDVQALSLRTNSGIRLSIANNGQFTFVPLSGSGTAVMGLSSAGVASRVQKVDSIWKPTADSIGFSISGRLRSVFVGGSGGTQTLQQVFDNDPLASPNISAHGGFLSFDSAEFSSIARSGLNIGIIGSESSNARIASLYNYGNPSGSDATIIAQAPDTATVHAEIRVNSTDHLGVTTTSGINITSGLTSFDNSINGIGKLKVIFHDPDVMLTTPTYVYVPDNDTMKVYPFPTGGGSGTVTNVATGLGLSGGPITTTGTLLVDTANANILSRPRAEARFVAKDSSIQTLITSQAEGDILRYRTSDGKYHNEQTIIDSPEHTYSGTPTFTAGTAPSGAMTASYYWTKTGKEVTVWLYISYAVAGATVTQMTIPVLPSDLPAVFQPIPYTGNTPSYVGLGSASTVTTTSPVAGRACIKHTAGVPTIICNYTSASLQYFWIEITYRTP